MLRQKQRQLDRQKLIREERKIFMDNFDTFNFQRDAVSEEKFQKYWDYASKESTKTQQNRAKMDRFSERGIFPQLTPVEEALNTRRRDRDSRRNQLSTSRSKLGALVNENNSLNSGSNLGQDKTVPFDTFSRENKENQAGGNLELANFDTFCKNWEKAELGKQLQKKQSFRNLRNGKKKAKVFKAEFQGNIPKPEVLANPYQVERLELGILNDSVANRNHNADFQVISTNPRMNMSNFKFHPKGKLSKLDQRRSRKSMRNLRMNNRSANDENSNDLNSNINFDFDNISERSCIEPAIFSKDEEDIVSMRVKPSDENGSIFMNNSQKLSKYERELKKIRKEEAKILKERQRILRQLPLVDNYRRNHHSRECINSIDSIEEGSYSSRKDIREELSSRRKKVFKASEQPRAIEQLHNHLYNRKQNFDSSHLSIVDESGFNMHSLQKMGKLFRTYDQDIDRNRNLHGSSTYEHNALLVDEYLDDQRTDGYRNISRNKYRNRKTRKRKNKSVRSNRSRQRSQRSSNINPLRSKRNKGKISSTDLREINFRNNRKKFEHFKPSSRLSKSVNKSSNKLLEQSGKSQNNSSILIMQSKFPHSTHNSRANLKNQVQILKKLKKASTNDKSRKSSRKKRAKTPHTPIHKVKHNRLESPTDPFDRLSRGKPSTRVQSRSPVPPGGSKHLSKIALEQYKRLPEYQAKFEKERKMRETRELLKKRKNYSEVNVIF